MSTSRPRRRARLVSTACPRPRPRRRRDSVSTACPRHVHVHGRGVAATPSPRCVHVHGRGAAATPSPVRAKLWPKIRGGQVPARPTHCVACAALRPVSVSRIRVSTRRFASARNSSALRFRVSAIDASTRSRMIWSTSRPWNPTSVNFVASTLMNGALAIFERRRAISVLPQPVGPIIKMFFGTISALSSSPKSWRRLRGGADGLLPGGRVIAGRTMERGGRGAAVAACLAGGRVDGISGWRPRAVGGLSSWRPRRRRERSADYLARGRGRAATRPRAIRVETAGPRICGDPSTTRGPADSARRRRDPSPRALASRPRRSLPEPTSSLSSGSSSPRTIHAAAAASPRLVAATRRGGLSRRRSFARIRTAVASGRSDEVRPFSGLSDAPASLPRRRRRPKSRARARRQPVFHAPKSVFRRSGAAPAISERNRHRALRGGLPDDVLVELGHRGARRHG